jgi:hypothetical protein
VPKGLWAPRWLVDASTSLGCTTFAYNLHLGHLVAHWKDLMRSTIIGRAWGHAMATLGP